MDASGRGPRFPADVPRGVSRPLDGGVAGDHVSRAARGGRLVTANLEPVEILLVEDDPGDVLITREAIATSKIANNLSVVTNGEEALAYLHQEPPHENARRPGLILLDLNLPRIDGREVLAHVKNDESL